MSQRKDEATGPSTGQHSTSHLAESKKPITIQIPAISPQGLEFVVHSLTTNMAHCARILLVSLLLGLVLSCQLNLWGQPKGDNCNAAESEGILNTPRYQETFAKEGTIACLQIAWGTPAKEGTSLLVRLQRSGQMSAYNATTQAFDGPVTFTLPKAAQGQARHFRVLAFGSASNTRAAQEALCQGAMRRPDYKCEPQASGVCWFAMAFAPQPHTQGLTAATLPGGCQLQAPDIPKETPTPDDAPPEIPDAQDAQEPVVQDTLDTSPEDSTEPPSTREPTPPDQVVQETMTDATPETTPDQAAKRGWAATGGTGVYGEARANVVTSTGDYFTTGLFQGSIIAANKRFHSVSPHIFIARMSSNGLISWLKQTSGSGSIESMGIARDGQDNAIVIGHFKGSITFGADTLRSIGTQDVFVAKLDKAGKWLWAKQAGAPGAAAQGLSVATDAQGNIILSGAFKPAINFGAQSLTSPGGTAGFVAKLSPDGSKWRWAKQAGNIARSVGTDTSANAYVVGNFDKTRQFDSQSLASAGGQDIFFGKLDASGKWIWVKKAGGNQDDAGQALAVGSDGNVAITGSYSGNVAFGTNTLLNKGGADIFVGKVDKDGAWLWAKGVGSSRGDSGVALTLNDQNEVYLTGTFQQQVSFGTSRLTASGGVDFFVAKLNKAGTWLWAKNGMGLAQKRCHAIAINAAKKILISGSIKGNATFGARKFSGRSAQDLFFGFLDDAGAWQFVFNASTFGTDGSSAIAKDSQGNLIITGFFQSIAVFGSITLTAVGSADLFVAKLDKDGNWLWAKQAGSTSREFGYGIAIDSQDNIVITGFYTNALQFGKSQLPFPGRFDIFVAKMDKDGNWLWAKHAGSKTADDRARGVAVDAQDNIFVAGQFGDTASFGTLSLKSAGDSDIFVAKLDKDGNWLWAQKAGGAGGDDALGVTVDAKGDAYITGSVKGPARFGPHEHKTMKDPDLYAAKIDSRGDWKWLTSAGNSGFAAGYAIALGAQGSVYFTGAFEDSVTLGGTTLKAVGSTDAFVAKLSPAGLPQWATWAGGSGVVFAKSLAVDGQGNAYVIGDYQGNINVGKTSLPRKGIRAVFAGKVDAQGLWQWAKYGGSASFDYGTGVALDKQGNPIFTGDIGGPATFGGLTLPHRGQADFFVWKPPTTP